MTYREIHTVFDCNILVRGWVVHNEPYNKIIKQFKYDEILPYATPSICDEYAAVFGVYEKSDTSVYIGKREYPIGSGTKDKMHLFIKHKIGRMGILGDKYDSGGLPHIARSEALDPVYKYIVGADRTAQACGRRVELVTENPALHELTEVLAPLSIRVIAANDYATLLGI